MILLNRKCLIRHSLIVFCFAAVAMFLSIFYFDLPIALFFNRPELETIYYYSREITNIGYSIHYFALALAGLIFSKLFYPRINYFKKRIAANQILQIHQWSIFSIKALVLLGVSVHPLKLIIGRQRPHASENFYPLNFDSFNLNPHWHSLPSGHAQVLFTVATLALLIWPRKKYLFLFLAIILTLTRVTIHQHYFSDVIAGGILGYLGTLWLYYLWPPKIY